jgi:hypothetical protein
MDVHANAYFLFSGDIQKKFKICACFMQRKKNQFSFTQPKNAHFDINSYFSTLLPINACFHSLSLLYCVLYHDI